MPRLSDSMEEGTILNWLVAEGDEVHEGQPLVEVETDKAVVIHEAAAAGTVLALIVSEGASVPVGASIAVLGAAGESLPTSGSPEALAAVAASPPAVAAAPRVVRAPPAPARAITPAGPPPALSEAPTPRVKASPLARRIAARLHVDIAALTGSGPHGRVIRVDVERAATLANGNRTPAASSPVVWSPSTPVSAPGGSAKGESVRQDLTRRQRTVARRMAESRATVPDIELRSEVDMTEAVALREQLRGVSDDILPSLNDLVVKAAALALREFPRVNGAYRDSQFETYSRVNVGIAVAADDALLVPTIFDADTKSLGEIARTARALAAEVRDGSITPADLAGGTFSISNLGMYGVDSFSAVINPPQAAILAVGSLRRRPVVDESGEIVARQTIQLSLACDHRIIYGVDGARFLSRVRELLEHPLSLLL
jgi:pyruvate dehydrogenase E2 component (dihydrolipoamide acetyltransferase)